MHFGSTDYLELIDKRDCYILFEKGAPSGRLKQDFVSLMGQDGRALEMRTPEGYRVCPVQLPREVLDDFIAASFIKQDGPEDAEGRIIFRLTSDGRAAARSRNAA
jgi:hypothetical protein